MTGIALEEFDLSTAVAEIASRLKLDRRHVQGAVELFDAGDTLPFIARYRKERTGGLDETQLRQVQDTLEDLRELHKRKATILKTIAEAGQLTDELQRRIVACLDRHLLEEIYLPFKPKRRTRASIARERGLGPLAEYLLKQENNGQSREAILRPYVDAAHDVPDGDAALRGACDIVAETWAENPDTRAWLRQELQSARVSAQVKRDWKGKPSKFETYYDYREPLAKIPSHRLLAIRRGEAEGVLQCGLAADEESLSRRLAGRVIFNPRFLFHKELQETASDCFSRLLFPAAESSILSDAVERAGDEAIVVFSRNLRDLLLAAPAGPQVVLGVDPGFRTGCKLAVVDGTGKLVAHGAIFPTPPRNDVQGAEQTLTALLDEHGIELVAIGNGTASREADAFIGGVLAKYPRRVAKAVVSEAGASVYSASEIAVREFPDLDVTVRGAISIARRLQDPLAELVKIDAKSIGVGQYQHDVNQASLRKALDREVESCVNLVGVDVNTASGALLSYVAGIGPKLAEAIVRRRDEQGPFRSREEIARVPRLGGKAFQQSAGFLRVRSGDEPLDNSAVHPESYYVIRRMAESAGVAPRQLIGAPSLLSRLRAADYVDKDAGLPTIQDILQELEKPGRDPRQEFRVVRFDSSVQEIADLREGMKLEGVITNVTRFGAFVDIGVHQDGLIHISELDHTFVKDPADVVSVGDIVSVKVLTVEVERKRIALSRKQA